MSRKCLGRQFIEDAGPMSHPIRPESYIAMDNFYTSTVYEKGAEVALFLFSLLFIVFFFSSALLWHGGDPDVHDARRQGRVPQRAHRVLQAPRRHRGHGDSRPLLDLSWTLPGPFLQAPRSHATTPALS